MTIWTCERHDTTQHGQNACPLCMRAFRERRPAERMSPEERARELEVISSQLTIPFSDLHQWIEELCGRPVWAHELAHPEELASEIRNGDRLGVADVISKLPWDKPVLLVIPDSGDVTELPA